MSWDLEDDYQRCFRLRMWKSVVNDNDVEVFLTEYLRQRLYWNLFPTITPEVVFSSIVTKFSELPVLSKLDVFLCFPYIEHMKNKKCEAEVIKLSNTLFVGIDEFVELLTEECRFNIANSDDGPEMILLKTRHLEEICASKKMKHYLPLSYFEAVGKMRTGLNYMISQLIEDLEVMRAFDGTKVKLPKFIKFLLRFSTAGFREKTDMIFTSDSVGIFKREPKFFIPLQKDPPPKKPTDSGTEVNKKQGEQISYERLYQIMREQEDEHNERINAKLSLTPSKEIKQEKLSFRQLHPDHPLNKISQGKRCNTSVISACDNPAKKVCDDPTKYSQQEEQTQRVLTDLKTKIMLGSLASTSLQNVQKQQLGTKQNSSNFQIPHQSCSEVKHPNFINSNQKKVDQAGNQSVFQQFNQTRDQESHKLRQQSRNNATTKYKNITPVLNRDGTPFRGINIHQPLFYETRFDPVSRTQKKVYFFGSVDLLSKLKMRPNSRKVANATVGGNNKSHVNATCVRTDNPISVKLGNSNSRMDETTHSAVGKNAPVKNIQTITLDDSNLDSFEMDPLAVIDHEEVVSTTENEFSDFMMEAEGNVEQLKLQTGLMDESNEYDYQTFDDNIFETEKPLQTEFLYGNEQETTSSPANFNYNTIKPNQSRGTQLFPEIGVSGDYSEFVHTKNSQLGSFTTDFDTDEFDDDLLETVDIEEIPDDGEILFEEPKVDDLFFSADEIEGLLSRKRVTEQATSTVTREEFVRLEDDYPALFCQRGLPEESRKIMAAFLLGRQKNPQPSQGYYFSVKISETIQFRPRCRVEIFFEMNFRSSTWRRLRKTLTYEGNDIVQVNEYLDGHKNRTEYFHSFGGPSFDSVKF